MFSALIAQLCCDVDTVGKVSAITDGVRNLLIAQEAALKQLLGRPPASEDMLATTAHELARLLPTAPDKLDWQIYDHCAALTRLYAIYERFVGELVGEYVLLLPTLYPKYTDLPTPITTQHRIGIGSILLKLGNRGRYKKLEEEVIVRELATGLSGSSGYNLVADAFLIDQQNLRFETLVRLFSSLGFKNCGKYISCHSAVTAFLKSERADSSSAQKELLDFIEYRNEAAHKKVDNVLAIDAIASMGRFLVALAHALADMVEEAVLRRHIERQHYAPLVKATETHYDGFVIIGIPSAGTRLLAGDDVVISIADGCHRAKIQSLQLAGQNVEEVIGDDVTEVGVRLSKRAAIGAQLCKLGIPSATPKELQLILEDATPSISDQADTDVSEPGEESPDNIDASEQP